MQSNKIKISLHKKAFKAWPSVHNEGFDHQLVPMLWCVCECSSSRSSLQNLGAKLQREWILLWWNFMSGWWTCLWICHGLLWKSRQLHRRFWIEWASTQKYGFRRTWRRYVFRCKPINIKFVKFEILIFLMYFGYRLVIWWSIMSASTAVPDITESIIRHWKMNVFIKCLANAKLRRILNGMQNVCNAPIHTKNLQLEYIITVFENTLIERS